ncbi:electron transfer flavoprotein subunit alpha/FixB family protein [Sphingobacterium lumbrici]|uniref:electron transfer flavoprotein subunit alpha/FixB family protein n=1 Tax=Sphingobacterium lumbrici TaxID=2559600 RepID=UPI00112A9A3A|nr:electron transfer flavoprotein subunit alpha/FixB family protein [Sphingobacterium lumbrici]
MSVLVYIENTEGVLKKSAFEVASYASQIANLQQDQAIAISIGDVSDAELQKLENYGISKVLTVTNDNLKSFVNQVYASIIVAAAQKEQANIVVLSNSFSGKGLAPRVAAKLEAGLVSGAISVPSFNAEVAEMKRTAFSSKAIATVTLTSPIKVITLSPNAFEIEERKTSAQIENFVPEIASTDFGTIVKEIIRATDKISLPEAEIVVSAGRGLKGPENWGMIEELAEVLGAATACSKPVSDAGWRPHAEHVGQTGIVVSPNLYIAIGISGAIQHLAGVSSSKTIVVINKDPEAPFFKVADYGIVGDAFVVVPQLIAALKAYKGN